ncbi:MAG: hypothetical protein WCC52_05905 [Nitrosotalea sp.]
MSQSILSDKKMLLLSFVAAGLTVAAGIIHLRMVPMTISHDIGEGILFLVGGALQVFWAVPVIKRWGRIWQIIGIVGTAVFSIIWFSTHIHSLIGGHGGGMPGGMMSGNMSQGFHGNMSQAFHGNMTGGNFPRGHMPTGIRSIQQVEYVQIAFIVLYAGLAKMISNKKKQAGIPSTEDKGKK